MDVHIRRVRSLCGHFLSHFCRRQKNKKSKPLFPQRFFVSSLEFRDLQFQEPFGTSMLWKLTMCYITLPSPKISCFVKVTAVQKHKGYLIQFPNFFCYWVQKDKQQNVLRGISSLRRIDDHTVAMLMEAVKVNDTLLRCLTLWTRLLTLWRCFLEKWSTCFRSFWDADRPTFIFHQNSEQTFLWTAVKNHLPFQDKQQWYSSIYTPEPQTKKQRHPQYK